MIRKALPIVLLLLWTNLLYAQDNKKDAKAPVYNYVIDDPMDHFSTVRDTTVQLK